ncbi:MAG: glutathione S-transferase family protein [Alphaproteobacteria bacterium]
MILYDDPISGNGFKLRLLFALSGQAYTYKPVYILKRETKADWFLAKNPAGQIPVVELNDGTIFRESNAMLVHFARDTKFWPQDPIAQTRVLEWLFWEQYVHEPNVAVIRSWYVKDMLDQFSNQQISDKTEAAKAALKLLDEALAGRDWLVGETMTIADISLYAYSHLVGDAGISLNETPNVKAWVERVAVTTGYVGIDDWETA